MLLTDARLRSIIHDILLEYDFMAAPPTRGSSDTPAPKKFKKMTKADATESIGFIKTIKPEQIQAAAPKVLKSLVNDGKLPSGYGKVQTAVANKYLKKSGALGYIKQWKRSIQEKDSDEYASSKAMLITRLGKFGGLGEIVLPLLMPDDMVTSVAKSVGVEMASGYGSTVLGALTSNAVETGMKTAAKGSLEAVKAGAKVTVGTIISLLSLYDVADFALRDADRRESLQKLVKNTFDVKYGRKHGTKFKLTKKAIRVVSYSA